MSANRNPDESARDRVRREKRKALFWLLIGLAVVLGCVVGIISYWIKVWQDWGEQFTKPVTYTMPAATQFIDQYASPMDPFGDFFYCAAFRLPQKEYESLLRHGFNWIYMSQGSTTPTPEVPKWQIGRLPESNLSDHCFNRLTAGPNEVTTYKYLFEEEKSSWQILLAIDEQSKTIFYYRGSW